MYFHTANVYMSNKGTLKFSTKQVESNLETMKVFVRQDLRFIVLIREDFSFQRYEIQKLTFGVLIPSPLSERGANARNVRFVIPSRS